MTVAPPLELRSRAVGPWPMNSYALVCPTTGESVLIDPGADSQALLEMLGDSIPVAILLTHTHGDHIGALHEMQSRLAVPLLAHPGPHVAGVTLKVDRPLADGDSISVGHQRLVACATPGHTGDMLCFMLADDRRVIVGDTIFEGGPGRTWSSADFQTTLATLRTVVLSWPDETICYPGHGPSFRLGERRAAIEAFVARDHGNFYGDASWS